MKVIGIAFCLNPYLWTYGWSQYAEAPWFFLGPVGICFDVDKDNTHQ